MKSVVCLECNDTEPKAVLFLLLMNIQNVLIEYDVEEWQKKKNITA